MNNHIVLDGTNLTPYIVDGSYNISSEDVYESWKDGNMMEHRVIITSKVSGSCNICCSNRSNSITLSNFLSHYANATTNGVTTIGVYVQNLGVFKAINAYVKIEPKEHNLAADGSFIDVFTLKIQER